MSDVSNSFSAWETLPEDEPPLCIAVRRPVSPPRHYEAVNRCGGMQLSSTYLARDKKLENRSSGFGEKIQTNVH